MSCLRNHVEESIMLEDWICPKCKATNEDFSLVNINSNIFTCSLLHYDDQVQCKSCGYKDVVSNVFVELIKNKVVRLLRKQLGEKQIGVLNSNKDMFFEKGKEFLNYINKHDCIKIEKKPEEPEYIYLTLSKPIDFLKIDVLSEDEK